jgi:hypothetical protein
MANRDTSELGGEGIAICPDGLISWVFTPVLGERGVTVKGVCRISLVTRAHFCRAVIMWGGSIRENEFLFFWLVCLEVAISLFACDEAYEF